jgi:high-affinity iron transporter
MVFTLAIVFASERQAQTPVHGNLLLVGAALGLGVALLLAFLMYRLGTKVNLKIFFRVLGIVLMFFAAGLLADAVENLQQLGWLSIGTHVMWNSSGTITESSNIGDVLHSMLGYADHPTVLQGVVYVAYVVVSVTTFIAMGRAPHRARPQTRLS